MSIVTVQKLQTIYDRTKYCLERYEEARNSDIELYARLCENFYPPFERPLYNWRDLAGAMHSVPSLDHIARCRRKVIRDNKYKKYLPTVRSIAINRGISEQIWKEFATLNNVIDHEAIAERNASNLPEGFTEW